MFMLAKSWEMGHRREAGQSRGGSATLRKRQAEQNKALLHSLLFRVGQSTQSCEVAVALANQPNTLK